MTYKWLTLVVVYYTNPLATVFGPLCLSLALYLVRATNEDKALVYNYL